MNLSDIHLLYDYNDWANQLMLTKAAELSPEQLAQPTDFSWGSLRGTLLHTMDTEYSWRMLCQHGDITADLAPENFPTLDSIAAYWENEQQEMRAYLNSLSDGDLDKIIRYEIEGGIVRERMLWHCLVHVVNHGTQHRSECGAMLTNFGHSPGDIDFTVFLNTLVKR